MKSIYIPAVLAGCLPALLLILAACGGPSPESEGAASSATEPPAAPTVASVHNAWWQRLASLCGQAYPGRLLSTDAADAAFADQLMVMHVRHCEPTREPTRIEVPFHVGDNHSRTWVLSRTETGIQLQHDHRHQDGTADAVTLYGGHTVAAGSEVVQIFPADPYSKELFEANDLAASSANVWSMEIVPGQRFSYNLRRPERFFRVDFDLSRPLDPPPAPWGAE